MNDLLLLKFIDNEASESESVEVLDWLAADPKNQHYFDELDFVHTLATVNKPSRRVLRPVPLRRNILRWSAGAAAILLLAAGVGLVVLQRNYNALAQQTNVIEVPAGQRVNFELPDGSKINLNSDTRIEYPIAFAKGERHVKLSGEAIFEVTPDTEHPFIVETFAGDVKVLGTKFDVVAYEPADKFSVSLLEGSVDVRSKKANGESIIMKPGERVRMVGDRLRLDGKVNGDDLLWVDGIFSITGLTFEEVIAKMEQYYNVNIVIERANLPKIRLRRGKIRISDGIDHALQILLQHGTDFTYENDRTGNTIIIK